ncbi:selenoB, glycine/betaine/sarcosine/D-prolinereductase family protein [[Clostridium] sordellii]|uniref:SelenoB, glycine/betaine/sarcosine/D-prolinereductase family protein n=2 Tax=Paraclostridium sordellii TaxID=1505 RepID=A0ABM9RQ83_PARSO|nr:selenoB, glycine/betaine/sarcosine/D-prolinereductase family protein [[Clostridium] sordellii] [Paeniclostridium sordellii]
MVKEFEKSGFPIVQMCNLIPVAKTVGANRIVPTVSIPYPMGDPSKSKEEQFKLRYNMVGIALKALSTDISEQTVFKN